MKKIKHVVLAFSLLTCMNCFGSPSDTSYVGSWQERGEFLNAVEINTDGTFRANIFDWGWQRQLPATGTYTLLGNRIEFDFADSSYPNFATIDNNGNLLLHYIRNEEKQYDSYRTLTRVKSIQLPAEQKQRGFNIYPVDTKIIPDDTLKVIVYGHVKFPGLYYWPKNRAVDDLIEFAVPLRSAARNSFLLFREDNGALKKLQLRLPAGANFQIRDGDYIEIDYIPL